MEKRYQVFVSSTYTDLKEERMEVITALLDMDCIPVGMEYFPASNDTAWEYIQPLIDSSDYYIVIIGGRYGSLAEGDVSFTRKEYEYAVSQGVPTLAFVHEDPGKLPGDRIELDPQRRALLDEFKALCGQRLLRPWATKEGLAGAVSRSLNREMRRRPRIGWVRGDLVSADAADEVVKLTKKFREEEEARKSLVDQYNQLVEDYNKLFEQAEHLKKKSEYVRSEDQPFVDQRIRIPYWDGNSEKLHDTLLSEFFRRVGPVMYPYIFLNQGSDQRPETLQQVLDDYVQEAIEHGGRTSKSTMGFVLSVLAAAGLIYTPDSGEEYPDVSVTEKGGRVLREGFCEVLAEEK